MAEADNAGTKSKCMDLRARLVRSFGRWSPRPPAVVSRGSRQVELLYSAGVFSAVDGLLYVVQRREKVPPWVTVYSGGKTTIIVDDLAPAHPHRFRLRVIIRASTVERMATGDPGGELMEVMEAVERMEKEADTEDSAEDESCCGGWVSSRWSGEAGTSTAAAGTTAACFSMAVRCGYLVQVQQMLEELPSLVDVVHAGSGAAPLAAAARRGDCSMLRVLLGAGAGVDQRAAGGRTALQLAALHGHAAALELLLASGADFTCRDVNSMRVEHFAVDSGELAMVRLVMARGDAAVRDSNGWTPLFRAVVQGSSAEIVKELLERGSDVNVTDRRGLTLAAAARLLNNRLGKNRDSILKQVDSQYQHEKVLANFTRITRKISSIQTLTRK